MHTAAIITEYNPFHCGHLYQIDEVKKLTKADHVLVLMSGNYVQRGCPAIFNKYIRTKMALANGADAIIELPVYYSCASAEYFAKGAVSLLEQCGCVDYLCFGCESDNLPLLKQIAGLLSDESEAFQKVLKSALKTGMPFAAARMEAVLSLIPKSHHLDAKVLLSSPNSILAIEYLKALISIHSSIEPVLIKRESDYHSQVLNDSVTHASASAIRTGLYENNPLVLKHIPQAGHQYVTHHYLEADDFSDCLIHSILYHDSVLPYFDVSADLENAIKNQLDSHPSFTSLANAICGKHITKSHCYRALLHILLQITDAEIESYIRKNYHLYIRLLGFRKEHKSLLTNLKKNSSLPLISKMSDVHSLLSKPALSMLLHNVQCDDLYRILLQRKYHLPDITNEYTTGMIVF